MDTQFGVRICPLGNSFFRWGMCFRKGDGFQIKGFPKGQNAEYFGKLKGCSPVGHLNSKKCVLGVKLVVILTKMSH